jgi:hypothetical protein
MLPTKKVMRFCLSVCCLLISVMTLHAAETPLVQKAELFCQQVKAASDPLDLVKVNQLFYKKNTALSTIDQTIADSWEYPINESLKVTQVTYKIVSEEEQKTLFAIREMGGKRIGLNLSPVTVIKIEWAGPNDEKWSVTIPAGITPEGDLKLVGTCAKKIADDTVIPTDGYDLIQENSPVIGIQSLEDFKRKVVEACEKKDAQTLLQLSYWNGVPSIEKDLSGWIINNALNHQQFDSIEVQLFPLPESRYFNSNTIHQMTEGEIMNGVAYRPNARVVGLLTLKFSDKMDRVYPIGITASDDYVFVNNKVVGNP